MDLYTNVMDIKIISYSVWPEKMVNFHRNVCLSVYLSIIIFYFCRGLKC